MTKYPIVHLKKSNLKYNLFELIEDCAFEFEDIKFTIPKGFTTDFASVPQIFWGLLPAHCNAAMPSVIHDYTCQFAILPRPQCDAVFLELLKTSGMKKWQYNLMFMYVRVFGWVTYNKVVIN